MRIIVNAEEYHAHILREKKENGRTRLFWEAKLGKLIHTKSRDEEQFSLQFKSVTKDLYILSFLSSGDNADVNSSEEVYEIISFAEGSKKVIILQFTSGIQKTGRHASKHMEPNVLYADLILKKSTGNGVKVMFKSII